MKHRVFLFSAIITGVFLLNSCQNNKNQHKGIAESPVLDNVEIEKAVTDSIYSSLIKEIESETGDRKDSILAEAVNTASETQEILNLLNQNNLKDAADIGHKLIGKLEVLLTKNPSAEFILVDVSFRKNELISDIKTVREIVKSAKKAMAQGYYQDASELLKGIKSEIIITDYYIPLATYPDAVKTATALIEDNKTEEAKEILRQLPSTIVITETVLPLPVLKAEQMIIKAGLIDAKNHDNYEKVLDLLSAAEYQLQLAEEMGYGNRDKDFGMLSEAIKQLKKSVENKSDSKSKFDSLKNNILKFKERVFPHKTKKDIK